MKAVLLLSSSRYRGGEYLGHAIPEIRNFLAGRARRVLLIPYASVLEPYETLEAKTAHAFEQLGLFVESIHRYGDPAKAIERADVIAVSGGNTFVLLQRLHAARLIEPLRERVEGGIPYVGWSAGANIASPAVHTTNDMPIIELASLRSLNVAPFYINPHYVGGTAEGTHGETRAERLAEFLAIHTEAQLFALPEGSGLLGVGHSWTAVGTESVLHLSHGSAPVEVRPGVPLRLAISLPHQL